MDEDVLTKNIEHFFNEGYTTVISTGAPFTQLYFIAKFKSQHPALKFIADLRDPWTKQDWSYGFQTIDQRRKDEEQKREKYVMEQADVVLTVADQMTRDLSQYVPQSTKFHTLHNGFDPLEIEAKTKQASRKLNFAYTGNLYEGAMGQLDSLVKGLEKIKEEKPGLFPSLSFDFYGNVPPEFSSKTKHLSVIKHHGNVSLEQAHQAIKNADVAMLFLIDKLNYSMSTKFFEYLAMDRSILLFSTEGDTSKYITQQKIGWYYDAEVFLALVDRLLDFKVTGASFDLPSTFDKEQFNIDQLCTKLESLL
jgi:hypothetical protein